MRPFAGAANSHTHLPRRPQRFPLRSLTIVTALATAFALPAPSFGLGLGKATGEPVLGETLQIEIPLTGSMDGPIENNCVSILRSADSVDPEYFPRDAVARVDRQAGVARLLLTTRSAIRQPLIEFRLAVSCGYNLSRDYLLAVSPREMASVPASAAPVPANASTRVMAVPAAPSVASSAGTPDGVPGRRVTLEQEMTLEQLARQHFPGPLRQERFMRWVAEANPQIFAGSADLRRHRIAAGTELTIPVGVPPRRTGDHQDGTSPLDAVGKRSRPATETPKPPTVTAKPAAKAGQDRLVVGSGGSARDYKETIALVQRLTTMMEQQVSTQAANEEKIRQLETQLADISRSLAQVESNAKQQSAQLQAEVQAARQAQEDLADKAWWQILVAVVAGGIVGAALLGIYRALNPRRQDSALSGFDSTPTPPAEPGVAAATPVEGAAGGTQEVTRAAIAARPAAPPVSRPVTPSITRKPKPSPDPLDFEPPSFLQSDPRRVATSHASSAAVAEMAVQETSDPATAAIELANIMTSMGLTESAAQTLVDHIRENPRQSLQHWLKLLELHRINGKREDFERSSQEMRQHFNVQVDEWASAGRVSRGTLESYPHIRNQVAKLWGQPDCVKYLHSLLMDNREGTRTGFPLSVAEEILLLIAIQSDAQ